MANIKQQVKRNLTNEKRRLQNASFKSSLKTAMKKINSMELTPPICIGDIIEEGFIEDDINLIATKTVEK